MMAQSGDGARYATGPGCDKVRYPNRKTARRATRRLSRNDLRAYRCDGCGLWHIGHLPRLVRRGFYTASEWYGGAS